MNIKQRRSQSGTRPRKPRWWAKLLLLAVSLFGTLLATELVFRLAGIRGEFHQSRYHSLFVVNGVEQKPRPYAAVPYSIERTHYDSDPRGYFGPSNTIDHQFNSVGLRDTEHSLQKAEGTYRILGLGDSYLFGQGVRLEDICLNQLGPLLQPSAAPLRIETINTGQSSINTAQERDILLHVGLQYDPDLILVHFVLNDVEGANDLFRPGPKVEFTGEYLATYMIPDALSEYSYLWSWARQRYLRSLASRAYTRACVASFQHDSKRWEQCRDALADIARIARQKNIPLLVVIFPFFVDLDDDYPFQIIHDTVREFCQSEQIAVLDLRDTFRDYSGPELWVHPTDQHPNEVAHRLAAQAIAKYLFAHPETYSPHAPVPRRR